MNPNQNSRRYLDDLQFEWIIIKVVINAFQVIRENHHQSIYYRHFHHSLLSIFITFSRLPFTIVRFLLSHLLFLFPNLVSSFSYSFSFSSFMSRLHCLLKMILLSKLFPCNLMIFCCTQIFFFASDLAFFITLFLLSNLL